MFVCRQPVFALIRLDISSRPLQEMYLHLIPPLTFLLFFYLHPLLYYNIYIVYINFLCVCPRAPAAADVVLFLLSTSDRIFSNIEGVKN
jgi:hypothetical protein